MVDAQTAENVCNAFEQDTVFLISYEHNAADVSTKTKAFSILLKTAVIEKTNCFM